MEQLKSNQRTNAQKSGKKNGEEEEKTIIPRNDFWQPVTAAVFRQNRVVRCATIIEYQMIAFTSTIGPSTYRLECFI